MTTDSLSGKLFVNLGASQCRRRLKGLGHGVRKVETVGNNKSVIIHTATGRHLRQLQAEFADVGYAGTEIGLDQSQRDKTPIVNFDETAAPSTNVEFEQEDRNG